MAGGSWAAERFGRRVADHLGVDTKARGFDRGQFFQIAWRARGGFCGGERVWIEYLRSSSRQIIQARRFGARTAGRAGALAAWRLSRTEKPEQIANDCGRTIRQSDAASWKARRLIIAEGPTPTDADTWRRTKGENAIGCGKIALGTRAFSPFMSISRREVPSGQGLIRHPPSRAAHQTEQTSTGRASVKGRDFLLVE